MKADPPTERVAVPECVARVAAGEPVRVVWRNEHGGLTFELGRGLDRRFLKWTPAPSRLDGRCTGHVDLGALGVADRWADLAVATWSTVWNYGPGWEDRLLDAYGVRPDPVRTRYYRLLWDLGP